MKSYGVNWFAVGLANFVFLWPLFGWLVDLLRPSAPLSSGAYIFAQSFTLTFYFTGLFYYGHYKTLHDREARERLRQKPKSRLASHPLRWPIVWCVLAVLVFIVSLLGHALTRHPTWPRLLAYSLVFPTCVLASIGLQVWASRNSPLKQLMEEDKETPMP